MGFDTIIIISSYNRYDKIVRLLDQLYTQNTKYTFKVIVINDGSTDDKYLTLSNYFTDIVYLHNIKNNGKKDYWKTINKLLKEAYMYNFKSILQLDDDFILCDDFLNVLLDKYYNVINQDDKYAAFRLHRSEFDESNRWGLKSNWVDGGTLYSFNFLNKFRYVTEISKSRWINNETRSSGVWQQVSNYINKHNYKVYLFNYSLLYHDGNLDSKMNANLRFSVPIDTYNFLNEYNKKHSTYHIKNINISNIDKVKKLNTKQPIKKQLKTTKSVIRNNLLRIITDYNLNSVKLKQLKQLKDDVFLSTSYILNGQAKYFKFIRQHNEKEFLVNLNSKFKNIKSKNFVSIAEKLYSAKILYLVLQNYQKVHNIQYDNIVFSDNLLVNTEIINDINILKNNIYYHKSNGYWFGDINIMKNLFTIYDKLEYDPIKSLNDTIKDNLLNSNINIIELM